MRKLSLIANQVVKKNLKSFSWWMLVLAPLLGLLFISGISWYSNSTNKNDMVAVVAPNAITTALKAQNNNQVTYKSYENNQKAQTALKNEDVDGILLVNLKNNSSQLLTSKNGDNVDFKSIQSNLSTINTAMVAQSLGLNQKQLRQLLMTPNLKKETVAFSDGKMKIDNSKSDDLKMMLAQVVGFAMYIFLMSYGSIVAQEIGTEKGSRIEESILTAVKAKTQFYGKLVGMATLVILQLLLYGVIALGVWMFRDRITILNDFVKAIPWNQFDGSFLLIILAFFIIGIVSYTILAALCGSLVSNPEQVGQAFTPILLLAMAGYVAALMVNEGSTLLMSILSYIPFISPIVMPVRYGIGQVGTVEALISLGINLGFMIVFTLFSARAYKKNVLIYNDAGIFKFFKKKK